MASTAPGDISQEWQLGTKSRPLYSDLGPQPAACVLFSKKKKKRLIREMLGKKLSTFVSLAPVARPTVFLPVAAPSTQKGGQVHSLACTTGGSHLSCLSPDGALMIEACPLAADHQGAHKAGLELPPQVWTCHPELPLCSKLKVVKKTNISMFKRRTKS